jgi:hypothetical protein
LSLPLRFFGQNCERSSYFPICATMTCPSHPDLTSFIVLYEEYQLWRSAVCNFLCWLLASSKSAFSKAVESYRSLSFLVDWKDFTSTWPVKLWHVCLHIHPRICASLLKSLHYKMKHINNVTFGFSAKNFLLLLTITSIPSHCEAWWRNK